MKKLLVAAVASVASVNAMADANPLDAVRDNLSELYNDIGGSGTWGSSDSNAAVAGLAAFAQHTDDLSRYDVSFSLGGGFSIDYKVAYDDSKINTLADDLANGVLEDLFGTKNQTDIGNNTITTDAGGGLSTDLDSDEALLYTLIDDELDQLNTAMESGSSTDLASALTDFEGAFDTFNTNFADTFWSDDVGELKDIDNRQDALDYGVIWDASRGQYVSGSGEQLECFATYNAYAKDDADECNAD